MRKLLTLYGILIFPIVATLSIVISILNFVFFILASFTRDSFYNIEFLELDSEEMEEKKKEIKEMVGPERLGFVTTLARILSIFIQAFINLYEDLKIINNYKF